MSLELSGFDHSCLDYYHCDLITSCLRFLLRLFSGISPKKTDQFGKILDNRVTYSVFDRSEPQACDLDHPLATTIAIVRVGVKRKGATAYCREIAPRLQPAPELLVQITITGGVFLLVS
jgi:hypothetical protein